MSAWPIVGLLGCVVYLFLECNSFWPKSGQVYLVLAKKLKNMYLVVLFRTHDCVDVCRSHLRTSSTRGRVMCLTYLGRDNCMLESLWCSFPASKLPYACFRLVIHPYPPPGVEGAFE